MLLVLISLTAVTIHEEGQVITDSLLTVDATGWRGVAGWIICAASLAIIIEGLMLTLRFLNPSCMNNNYSICGGLVKLLHVKNTVLRPVNFRIFPNVYWLQLGCSSDASSRGQKLHWLLKISMITATTIHTTLITTKRVGI